MGAARGQTDTAHSTLFFCGRSVCHSFGLYEHRSIGMVPMVSLVSYSLCHGYVGEGQIEENQAYIDHSTSKRCSTAGKGLVK